MSAATLAWFARHEARLAWRDWLAMATAGKPGRLRWIALALVVFAAILHRIADRLITPYVDSIGSDVATFLVMTGSAGLTWTLMLSQGMESVTRAFYSRSDLDLILSSPASGRTVFGLRIGATAFGTALLAVLLVGPFVNILAWRFGPQMLAAYGVVVALALLSTAFAVLLTTGLFRLLGAKRTRLVAQVVAAVVGAGFVIGVQAFAIVSYGNLSRVAVFLAPEWVEAAPGIESMLWLPARAALGDIGLMLALLTVAFTVLALTIAATAGRFADNVIAASGISHLRTVQRASGLDFRPLSVARALRHKEWLLLRRDPWLVSQSLMQLLYLLPPALLLWRKFGDKADALVVLAPVIVMAAGQLAGGLAWLAISGEDAPELVATAPVTPGAVTRAKIEAVLGVVALAVLPLVVALAVASPFIALVTLLACGMAAAGATAVQFFFRAQARRSQFRRRQTSSRFATFAEAFVSISIAAAAGLAAAENWQAIFALLFAGLILLAAYRSGSRQR
ncbi:MAG TPA: permease [Beijerinckiaceae bacterium]|nr:permease [Beijerinckiaceae bacterium]